jgi:hypothetical protein
MIILLSYLFSNVCLFLSFYYSLKELKYHTISEHCYHAYIYVFLTLSIILGGNCIIRYTPSTLKLVGCYFVYMVMLPIYTNEIHLQFMHTHALYLTMLCFWLGTIHKSIFLSLLMIVLGCGYKYFEVINVKRLTLIFEFALLACVVYMGFYEIL